MEDWNQGGNFMNKPVRGWLHPDKKIADSGISYGVRYIGCLEVNTSMKSLDFDTRSLIAKAFSFNSIKLGLTTEVIDLPIKKWAGVKKRSSHPNSLIKGTVTWNLKFPLFGYKQLEIPHRLNLSH
ncbi:SHC-transforming protein 1 [Trichonephila clavipes]|nr:SHC-transforming protein 1 [Trichonephila clavipes]